MTSLFGDLHNPNKVETFEQEFGVPAGSPLTEGARQTGQSITTEGWSVPVTETSIEAYRGLDLPAREAAVLIGLRRYAIVHGHAPTSYELFRDMQAEGCAFDINAVRPRLTALWKKSLIIKSDWRACAVTGKNAYTWAITKEEK